MFDEAAGLLCSWNQSFVSRPYQSWGPEFPIGTLSNTYPPSGVTYSGNTGGAPGKAANDATACTDYSAVTAVAATGLHISANHNTQALPRPSTTGALLRLGTDSKVPPLCPKISFNRAA